MFHVGIDVMNTCDRLIGIQRNVPFRRLGTSLIITFMLLFLTYTQAIDTDITCTDLCRLQRQHKNCSQECITVTSPENIPPTPTSTTPSYAYGVDTAEENIVADMSYSGRESLLEYSRQININRTKRATEKDDCERLMTMLNGGHPQLHLIEESYDFSLVCDPCAEKPDTNTAHKSDEPATALNITWFIRNFTSTTKAKTSTHQVPTEFSKLVVDGDHFVQQPSGNLLLEDVKVKQGAEYMCHVDGEMTSLHHVDVVKKEKRVLVVPTHMKGIHPEPEKYLKTNNLVVYTLWSEWGGCTRCNARGERKRQGKCKVIKWDPEESVKPVDVPNLTSYSDGVPCRSTALPPVVAALDEIALRHSETQITYCFQPCPTVSAIKQIKDTMGNVVEVVKTGHGFRSMMEGRPTFPPLVKRKTVYQEVDAPLVLECPYEKADVDPVRWQNGSQMITHLAVREQHMGRVEIDLANRLVIDSCRYSDTAPYSCWLHDRHIATIKVKIVASFSTSWLRSQIANVGVGIAIFMLVFIGFSVLKTQRSDSARFE